MKEYLVYLAQSHVGFRLAELESLAEVAMPGVDIDLAGYNEGPYLVVRTKGASDAGMAAWIGRCVLARAVYELWGEGRDYEELHKDVQRRQTFKEYTQRYRHDSFKFDFECYRGNSKANRVEQIESFGYLGFEGRIEMRSPQQVYTVLEEYVPESENLSSTVPVWLRFGRLIAESDRSAMEKYDLKKRPYKGTTSFEAELSLLSCNIAQVRSGTIMYDPFAGTGSFLVAGGHYGALVMGSDIDGRMIRGNGASQNISANFKKYGNSGKFLDVMTMDFTHNALRSSLLIDTIVCDPPYGIRESIKVLGARNPGRFLGKENIEINGKKAYLHRDYIPTKKPYALDALLDDILQFASERLPINGRLALWMPTANDENIETIIPLHENLELKYNCVQEFNKWSRRLLVYINRGDDYHGPTNGGTVRSQNNFRERYFKNFS